MPKPKPRLNNIHKAIYGSPHPEHVPPPPAKEDRMVAAFLSLAEQFENMGKALQDVERAMCKAYMAIQQRKEAETHARLEAMSASILQAMAERIVTPAMPRGLMDDYRIGRRVQDAMIYEPQDRAAIRIAVDRAREANPNGIEAVSERMRRSLFEERHQRHGYDATYIDTEVGTRTGRFTRQELEPRVFNIDSVLDDATMDMLRQEQQTLLGPRLRGSELRSALDDYTPDELFGRWEDATPAATPATQRRFRPSTAQANIRGFQQHNRKRK